MEMNIEERKKLRDEVLGEIDLPIFRAKKIDSNEYIQGSFINHYYDTVNLTRYQNVIFIYKKAREFEFCETGLWTAFRPWP